MRAVIQRVSQASVTVEGKEVARIGKGFLVLLGVAKGDSDADAEQMASRTIALRIFEDDVGKMNLSLGDVGGEVLAVSQFTLMGDARHGRRPAFTDAMEPQGAARLYDLFCDACARGGIPVKKGIFRADMKVSLVNDGPVTILMDSKKVF